MRNVSPLLINMPTDMAEAFTDFGKRHHLSRTRVILEACNRFLNEHQSKPQPQNRGWLQPDPEPADDQKAPPSFFSTIGSGF